MPEMPDRVEQLQTIQDEARELFKNKNADYGDEFANYGPVGVLVRLGDKIQRLQTISKTGISLVEDEKFRDTLIDLHNYSAMAIMLMDEKNDTPESDTHVSNPSILTQKDELYIDEEMLSDILFGIKEKTSDGQEPLSKTEAAWSVYNFICNETLDFDDCEKLVTVILETYTNHKEATSKLSSTLKLVYNGYDIDELVVSLHIHDTFKSDHKNIVVSEAGIGRVLNINE